MLTVIVQEEGPLTNCFALGPPLPIWSAKEASTGSQSSVVP